MCIDHTFVWQPKLLRFIGAVVLIFLCAGAPLFAPTVTSAPPPEEVAATTLPPILDAAITGAVVEAYESTLCRAPDVSGLSYWGQQRLDERRLTDALAGSTEGLRVTQVRSTYLQLLARDPLEQDCRGLRSWVDSGLSPDQINSAIATSREAARVGEVRRSFTDVVGRDPLGWDNATLRRWVESGLSLDVIQEALVAERPQVGVYYFTWYAPRPTGWGNDATVVTKDAPKPELGWYRSTNPDVLEQHITQMEEAGFDFIIVDVVAQQPGGWASARALFAALQRHELKAAVMLDGLYDATPEDKAMYVRNVAHEFIGNDNYFFFNGRPVVMLFASSIDFPAPGVDLRDVYWTKDYTPGANTYSGVLNAEEWAFWSPSPQPVTNGVVPVLPGYDDTSLGRLAPMHHSRDGGVFYRDQWLRALQLRPSIITVYSWNEHFEKTAIEPTDQWGDQYLRWTACYIAAAHNGGSGDGCQAGVQ